MADWQPRRLESEADRDAGLLALARVFVRHGDPARVVRHWRRRLAAQSNLLGLVGEVREEQALGAAVVLRRELSFGPAVVSVAILRQLGVLAEHRNQGLGSAIVSTVQQVAREAGATLLLAEANDAWFLRRGFTRMYDPLVVSATLSDGRATAPRAGRIRPIGPAQAPVIDRLYQEHFATHLGAPARDLNGLLEQLGSLLPGAPPVVALGDQGDVRGYLLAVRDGWWVRPEEFLALDQDAAVDLVRFHANRTGAWGAAERLRWVLPSGSPTLASLAAAVPHTVEPTSPDKGPMGLVADRRGLLAQLEPLFQARAGRCRPSFDQASDQALVQLVFGYRRPSELGLAGEGWEDCFPPAQAWLPEIVGR